MNDNLPQAWSRLLLGSMASSGVTDIVLSPGSRSTPLALAADAEPRLRIHRILDERVAAFYALGQARVTGRPSVLVCTSGTAPAHYFPAVIEASEAHLPLCVLSADRPWELRHVGAAQTTDQTDLFGRHVRYHADLGPPEGAIEVMRGAMRVAAHAVFATQSPVPGPVHLNAQFRKPLEPSRDPEPAAWQADFERLMATGAPRLWSGAPKPDDDMVAAFVAACRDARAGVIACGPAPPNVDPAEATRAVTELARATGFVVLSEATSQVRPLDDDPGLVCTRFDLFLADPAFRAQHAPDLVIELGGALSSTSYARYLADHPDARRIVVAHHAPTDPTGGASDSMVANPIDLAKQATKELARDPACACPLRVSFCEAEDRARDAVARGIRSEPRSEAAVAAAVVAALPEGARFVVGNSSPVRDVDAYGDWRGRRDVQVLHQRGVNGIDGMLAGAAGARSVSDRPVVALVGDCTALHDAGGLAAISTEAGTTRSPLVIVVVNNLGGRLFERLPLADPRCPASGAVEDLFVMPHEVDFAALARAYGVLHASTEGAEPLAATLRGALSRCDGTAVLEARVPPRAAAAHRAKLVRACERPLTCAVDDRDTPSATPRLALLHGFLGDTSMWHDVLQHTKAPATLLRLPGHGREAMADAQLPLERAFEHAAKVVADALPTRPCVLVGYSMGGRLAMRMAAHHASALAGVVLLAGHPGLSSARAKDERRAWEDEQVRRLRRDGLVEFAEAWARMPLFDSQTRVPPERLARQRAARRRHTEDGIAWAIRALGLANMPNQRDALAAARLPIWLVVGEHDEKYRDLAEQLVDTLQDGHLIVVPEAGHNVALEAPERLASLLDEIASQRLVPGTGAARNESCPAI